MPHILFALAGLAAVSVLAIETRRAFQPGSAVRQLLGQEYGE